MTDQDKPRICEVLGVEVGEQFTVKYFEHVAKAFWVTDEGFFETEPHNATGSSRVMMYAINHPDCILRKPCFTREEVEDAKTVVYVFGREEVFKRQEDSGLTYGHLYINKEILPSLRPGQSVKLEEIIGEST